MRDDERDDENSDLEAEEELENESAEPAERRDNRQESRRRDFRSARELILEGVQERARQADGKLRSQLVGSIVVEIKDRGEKYLFDWSTDQLKVAELTKDAPQPSPIDTTIVLSEQHLMRISQSELNPQIAMLSDKINVIGKAGLAIYFFNLVVPRGGG